MGTPHLERSAFAQARSTLLRVPGSPPAMATGADMAHVKVSADVRTLAVASASFFCFVCFCLLLFFLLGPLAPGLALFCFVGPLAFSLPGLASLRAGKNLASRTGPPVAKVPPLPPLSFLLCPPSPSRVGRRANTHVRVTVRS